MKNKSLIESALPKIREMEAKRLEYELEIERCKDTLYFYNNYVRKEGEEEITDREVYDKYMRHYSRFRTKVLGAALYNYPQPPEDCEL